MNNSTSTNAKHMGSTSFTAVTPNKPATVKIKKNNIKIPTKALLSL